MLLLLICYIVVHRDVTFICGRAGVCALGAVAAKYAGNEQLLNYYLTQFRGVNSCVYSIFNVIVSLKLIYLFTLFLVLDVKLKDNLNHQTD